MCGRFRSQYAHMVSKKDVNKAELETVRISKNPIMVVTAKGEVQTKEATVYVRELGLFVTVMLLGDAPAVLSHHSLSLVYRQALQDHLPLHLLHMLFLCVVWWINLCGGSWVVLSGRELMRMIGVGISFVSRTKQRIHTC